MFRYIRDLIVSIIVYWRNVLRCRDVDYFQYEELSSVDFSPIKSFHSVLSYGNYKAVASLIKRPFNFVTDYLEHGINFGVDNANVSGMGYFDRFCVRNIFTYSDFRKQTIERICWERGLKHKNVYAIGPYILGAKHFHSQYNLGQIKDRYGKILLVYPIHSAKEHLVNYDNQNLIDEIEKVRGRFQAVFVCMYWLDIHLHPEYVEKYRSKGYVVVTNGHGSDPKFLSRQKDLIYLSDMMLTNGCGTHIGYSISMSRPVYVVATDFDKQNAPQYYDGVISVSEACSELFGHFSFEITEEQRQFIRKYWGNWPENKD